MMLYKEGTRTPLFRNPDLSIETEETVFCCLFHSNFPFHLLNSTLGPKVIRIWRCACLIPPLFSSNDYTKSAYHLSRNLVLIYFSHSTCK